MSDAEVSQLLISFLVHVPNHVAAASKLYTDIPVTDIFGVGATSENPNEIGLPSVLRAGSLSVVPSAGQRSQAADAP